MHYCGVIYLANAFTITTTSILRTVGTVKIALYSTLASLLVNVFFNYGLIFGKLGMPQMGVAGAALATMIARLVEFAIITVFFVPNRSENLFSDQRFLAQSGYGNGETVYEIRRACFVQ